MPGSPAVRGKAAPGERREIEQLARELDDLFNRAQGESDPEFLYFVRSRHVRFHLRIAECAGCRALRQILEKNHVLMFTWLFDIAARRPVLPRRHHRELARAINRGTPDEADRAMRAHTREGVEAIMRALAESPPHEESTPASRAPRIRAEVARAPGYR